MNKKRSTFQKQGFIAVATMVLMLASLGVIITMLHRSVQGNLIASKLKQSNQAYQLSDSSTESILQKFRYIDDGQNENINGVDSTTRIPENISISSFCSVAGVTCYDAGTVKMTDANLKLSDVAYVSASNTTSSVSRAIQTSLPRRIAVPVMNDFSTTVLGGVVTLTWDASFDTVNADEIEIRRAGPLNSTQDASEISTLLSDTSLEWTMIGTHLAAQDNTTSSMIDTVTSPGSYVYAMKVTNKRSLMLDSLYSEPVKATVAAIIIPPSGSLAGSVTTDSTAVDLTIVGTSDWAHWFGYDHKVSGGNQISDYAIVGVGSVFNYGNDPRTLSWSDGNPTASSSNENGSYIAGTGKGFSLSVPADLTSRTLKVYVGGWQSGGKLTARLSDASATDYVDTTPINLSGQYDGNYTLTYKAASAGQTLTVEWIQESGIGNVTLSGAALSF